MHELSPTAAAEQHRHDSRHVGQPLDAAGHLPIRLELSGGPYDGHTAEVLFPQQIPTQGVGFGILFAVLGRPDAAHCYLSPDTGELWRYSDTPPAGRTYLRVLRVFL